MNSTHIVDGRSAGSSEIGRLYQVALVRFNQKDFYGAAEVFTSILKLDRTSLEAQSNRAVCYIQLGKLDEAIADLTAVIKNPAVPHVEVTWNNLGNVHERRGEFARAIECYDQAFRIQPTYPEALFNKAEATRKSGQPARGGP